MNCFIVCNMYPPAKLNCSRAPGLRAEQLFYQAKLNFEKVKYLMLTSRKELLFSRNKKYIFKGFYQCKDFIYLDDDTLDEFIKRISPSVFVFSQLEMKEAFFKVRTRRHFIIYDILAPRHLEYKCSNNFSNELVNEAIKLNSDLINSSNRVFVNGKKNINLFKKELSKHKNVLNNPFCPISKKPSFNYSRNKILFFSGGQRWVDNSLFLKNIYECLSKVSDINAIFISDMKSHENPESKFISKLVQLPNVIRYESLSYSSYKVLLTQVAGTLDWSAINEERIYSTSTRIIQSVSMGSAVFTLANTGLDYFWGDFPGEKSKNPPTPEEINKFLKKSIDQSYIDNLKNAFEWNLKVVSNKKYFDEIYI